MAVQAVDLFAPEWISTNEALSTRPTPMSSSSYAGRLVGRPEGSTNNNAQTVQDRDEKLLKRTSLKYARNLTKKTRQYCRDSADRGPVVTDVDDMRFYDDHDEFSVRPEGEPPCDEFQPSWIRQNDPEMKDTENEEVGDGTLMSERRTKTKSKAVRTWRRQVRGLQDQDDDTTAEKFAPIWMKKKALPSSPGENVGAIQTPRCPHDADVASTLDRSASQAAPEPSVAILPDRGPAQALSKSEDGLEETRQPNKNSSSTTDVEEENIIVPDNDPIEVDCVQEKRSSPIKIESQESSRLSSVLGSCDSQPRSPVLPNECEYIKVAPEGQVNRLIFQVLLTAVVTLLVEEVIEDSIRETEDELLIAIETFDLLDLSNFSTDESSFQSDGWNYQDQSWSDHSTVSTNELMSDETPPWGSEYALLEEEGLINACLQEDARENGYAASVAVMDGGDTEGIVADVVLLWSQEGDSFNTSGDSPGVDEDVTDFGRNDEARAYLA